MLKQNAILSILTAIVCASAIFIAPCDAHAKIPRRRVGLTLNDNQLTTTFSYRDVFTKKVRSKLNSGLPTRIVVQIVLENHKGKPLAFWAQTVNIVYDLWEENFSITVKDPKGKRRTRVNSVEEVTQIAGVLWRTPIIQNQPPGTYRLRIMAEANPVSEEMVRNIQRWISRPSSGYGNTGTGSNYFGSFVGYFVDRRIGKADKTVHFVSQWFSL